MLHGSPQRGILCAYRGLPADHDDIDWAAAEVIVSKTFAYDPLDPMAVDRSARTPAGYGETKAGRVLGLDLGPRQWSIAAVQDRTGRLLLQPPKNGEEAIRALDGAREHTAIICAPTEATTSGETPASRYHGRRDLPFREARSEPAKGRWCCLLRGSGAHDRAHVGP
jgi:hypothetical protein